MTNVEAMGKELALEMDDPVKTQMFELFYWMFFEAKINDLFESVDYSPLKTLVDLIYTATKRKLLNLENMAEIDGDVRKYVEKGGGWDYVERLERDLGLSRCGVPRQTDRYAVSRLRGTQWEDYFRGGEGFGCDDWSVHPEWMVDLEIFMKSKGVKFREDRNSSSDIVQCFVE